WLVAMASCIPVAQYVSGDTGFAEHQVFNSGYSRTPAIFSVARQYLGPNLRTVEVVIQTHGMKPEKPKKAKAPAKRTRANAKEESLAEPIRKPASAATAKKITPRKRVVEPRLPAEAAP